MGRNLISMHFTPSNMIKKEQYDNLVRQSMGPRMKICGVLATMVGSKLSGNGSGDDRNDGGVDVVTKPKPKTKKPPIYRVLLLNDDYTPMEFVVHVLERYFNKDQQEATQIMLHVHQKGIGVCGIYPFEIAETKVMQVTDLARKNQHPLQCTMEKI